ncbi:Co-chaperone Hsc20 [Cryphonectria parasitica EP155]|uniref:Co-chaperone Hsc20 n=1 Tax=Cryphonectria parasitica (strain ATCC 38755 / EP155) TaxID=660469 RepID=A0A9P5CTF1_CRYP1|nr:Co-chaperone Hsc20 [Cryphonectria parasitica EP155]KAF3769341.1 Co-chaperone Hsc20 [Cryphonectria parasitica EP155]
MRASLVASKSRGLSGLCAACARKRLATFTTTATTLFARTYSTRTDLSPPPILQVPSNIAFSRRWSSASAPLRAKQDDSASQIKEETSQPKISHKPLPFYSLFPQTLPDGPPPTGPFEIDVRALRREFLQLQAASHPDFHHAASASADADPPSTTHSATRRKAEALSSHINTAYKTLSSPLLRAQYILSERYGIDLAGDEASSLTGPPDPDLLTEVLYARETIEEAASEKDLEGVRVENEERIKTCLAELVRAFAAEDVQAAVRETVRLRYWENIRESVRNWEEGKPIVLQH